MNRINRAVQNGELSPEDGAMLSRLAKECMIAYHAEADGRMKTYRACAEQLRTQADLCDRGLTPSADMLRCMAAVWEYMANELQGEE